MEISRDLSSIMKGYAIIFIALHNFLHLQGFGLVQENEMRFEINRTYEMFDNILNPTWSIIGHMISFIGWCGVPLFVFLSGYGLMRKYSHRWADINIKRYIIHSYFKLFLLMLPGAIIFILYYLFIGDWYTVFRKLLAMTMLNNLCPPFITTISSVAPPYWYFGMTLQLYILFIFVKQNENKSKYLFYLFFVMPILIQIFLTPKLVPDQEMLSYLRRNCIGWLPVFYLGIVATSNKFSIKKLKVGGIILMVLISLIMLFIMNLNYVLWLFMPIIAVMFFYFLSLLTSEINAVKRTAIWIGNLSPFIFVFHPISILLYQKIMVYEFQLPLWLLTICYCIITVCGAKLFKEIHKYILTIPKIKLINL